MMKKTFRFLMPAVSLLLLVPSCSPDDDDVGDYKEWKDRNEAYVNEIVAQKDDAGQPLYTRLEPKWAIGAPCYVRWIDDRTQTDIDLTPLDNSTVMVNYTLTDIDGNILDKGVNTRFKPCNTVTGFWTTLTNMQVGDTVQSVVPANAGYDNGSSGKVKPYSTLIFGIRLKEIVAYEFEP